MLLPCKPCHHSRYCHNIFTVYSQWSCCTVKWVALQVHSDNATIWFWYGHTLRLNYHLLQMTAIKWYYWICSVALLSQSGVTGPLPKPCFIRTCSKTVKHTAYTIVSWPNPEFTSPYDLFFPFDDNNKRNTVVPNRMNIMCHDYNLIYLIISSVVVQNMMISDSTYFVAILSIV